MKKYIFILVFILVLICGYFYVYKVHRTIATENEAYSGDVETLFLTYQEDELGANLKYLDKTILVSGVVSSLEKEHQTLVLNKQLFAVLTEEIPETLVKGSKLKIKGRLIGYDSLLEELKLDQCVIVK